MVKADQARVRDLLTQTITLMCRNGLEFSHNLRVEGLLAVTVDGTDIFVIHMDEKVTDRPSYAAGFRCSESSAECQQRDSASSGDADEVSANHLNDNLLPSTSSAVGDESERSLAFHVEDVHSVKREADAEESDGDDVMIVESDVRSLMDSNIPLPVVQGMSECEDGSPYRAPLSPISKRRKINHKRMSLGGVRASVGSTADDQQSDMWTSSPSCTPHSNNVCVPRTRESDIFHHTSTYDMLPHTSFLPANGSQALVSS